jgi:hypothetical protein
MVRIQCIAHHASLDGSVWLQWVSAQARFHCNSPCLIHRGLTKRILTHSPAQAQQPAVECTAAVECTRTLMHGHSFKYLAMHACMHRSYMRSFLIGVISNGCKLLEPNQRNHYQASVYYSYWGSYSHSPTEHVCKKKVCVVSSNV